jgi:acyl-CoA synthetase (AMP-forming)/AMP-acid ligase II
LLDEMDRRSIALPALRTGLIGGAFLPPDLCRDATARLGLDHLAMVYGQTESGPTLSVTRPGDLRNSEFDTAGPPLPGVEIRIADPDTGAVLPPGATGEIQARGPTMMSGYFGDPEATAAAFTGDGWLRTGDLGRLADGRIQVVGRLKELIIRGGENLSPWEIEEAMRRAPGVADICALPAPSDHWGEEICAVVAADGTVDEAALRDHAVAALPRHMRPDQYRIVEALPLLANGKVDRVALMAAMTQEAGDA